MHPLKALGPDGLAAGFYQQYWSTVGGEIRIAIMSFLQSGIMNYDLNSTYIALILKATHSTKVT
jgi:hypothetical protein